MPFPELVPGAASAEVWAPKQLGVSSPLLHPGSREPRPHHLAACAHTCTQRVNLEADDPIWTRLEPKVRAAVGATGTDVLLMIPLGSR